MVLKAGRAIWRAAVPHRLRRIVHRVISPSAQIRVMQGLRRRESPARPGSLVVSGLINESKGVSQAARLTLAGLEHAGLLPVGHDLRQLLTQPPGAKASLPFSGQGGVWMLHANPPEAIHSLSVVNPAIWRRRHRIGYWVWELPVAPQSWAKASSAFHNVWAPSRFAADAMRASGFLAPVHVIPHPVSLLAPRAKAERAAFGLAEDALVVLAMADLNSSADRKNLIGAIEIYIRASREFSGRACLVVKTQADAEHKAFSSIARRAAHGRDDIRFITGSLPHDRVHALIASADVLLSPHRAEGFGLSLAEAFMLGVPALATGWSGNLEFMGSLPELLIKATLRPAVDSYGIYNVANQSWAEIDVADAVAKLEALLRSATMRRRLADAGRVAVEAMAEPWRPGGEVAGLLAPYVSEASASVA